MSVWRIGLLLAAHAADSTLCARRAGSERALAAATAALLMHTAAIMLVGWREALRRGEVEQGARTAWLGPLPWLEREERRRMRLTLRSVWLVPLGACLVCLLGSPLLVHSAHLWARLGVHLTAAACVWRAAPAAPKRQ